MKQLFVVLISLFYLSEMAYASEDTCRNIMTYSKFIIGNKQHGKPIDEVLKENDKLVKDWSDKEKRLANIIIQQAYSLPSYNNEKLKQSQSNSFIADQYLACKKSIN